MLFDFPMRAYAPQQNRSGSGTQSQLVQKATHLVGYRVKVNRGGPDMVEGTLLAIPSDYLVLNTNDGIIYVNGAHVKSITEISKSGGAGSRSSSRGARSFISASSFNSLLSRLRHQFIQINRGGPEKIDGFLAEITSGFLLVVVNRELVRIPLFHIKTVNVSGKNNQSSGEQKSGGSSSGSSGRSSGKSSRSRGKSGSSGHRSHQSGRSR